MLKLDFLQKHTIMLLKAELKGLNYTFPQRKNFYSILNNRIKNPFKRKRKKNLFKGKKQQKSSIPMLLQQKPRQQMLGMLYLAHPAEQRCWRVGTTQNCSCWKAAWIPNREKSWERGNNFLLLTIYSFDSGQEGITVILINGILKRCSCLTAFACVKGELSKGNGWKWDCWWNGKRKRLIWQQENNTKSTSFLEKISACNFRLEKVDV